MMLFLCLLLLLLSWVRSFHSNVAEYHFDLITWIYWRIGVYHGLGPNKREREVGPWLIALDDGLQVFSSLLYGVEAALLLLADTLLALPDVETKEDASPFNTEPV